MDALQLVGGQIHDKAAAAVNNNEAVLPNKGMLLFLCDLYGIDRALFKWELVFHRLQGLGKYIALEVELVYYVVIKRMKCILIAILLQEEILVCTTIHCGKTKSTLGFGDGLNWII